MANSFLDALVDVEPRGLAGREADVRGLPGFSLIRTQPPVEQDSYLEGFLKSTLSAATKEFVGLDPIREAESFRAKHPISSIISQGLGFGVPFLATGGVSALGLRALGASGAARAIPAIGRTLAWMNNPAAAAARPFSHAAVTEMIKFAPAEAARLGLSAAVGDPTTVAQQIPINLATVGAVSALFRGFSATFKGGSLSGGSGPGPKGGLQPNVEFEGIIQRYVKDYDPLEAPQIKYRKLLMLRKAVEEEPSKYPTELGEAIEDVIHGGTRGTHRLFAGLKRQIIDEVPAGTFKPVRPLENTTVDHRQLVPWFKVGRKNGRHVKYLREGPNGFSKKKEGELFSRFKARLPADAEAYMQFPRAITFENDAAAASFRRMVYKMQPISSKAFMAREQDGFFIIAEKVKGRAFPPGKVKNLKGKTLGASESDAWLLYKTDAPEIFFPEHSIRGVQLQRDVWGLHKEGVAGALPKVINFGDRLKHVAEVTVDTPAGKVTRKVSYTDTELGRFLATIEKELPGEQTLAGLSQPDRVRALQNVVKNPELRVALEGAGNTAEDTAKRILGPLTVQFSKAPYLHRPLTAAMSLVARARKIANDAWTGEQVLPAGRSPIGSVLSIKPTFAKGSPKAIFEELTEEEFNQLKWIHGLGYSLKDVRAMKEVTPRVKRFLGALEKANAKMLRDYNFIHKLEGKPLLDAKPEHFGFVMRLGGNARLPVLVKEDFVDASGKVIFKKDQLIAIADGTLPGQAKARANEFIEMFKQFGIKTYTRSQDINRELDISSLLSEAAMASPALRSVLHLKTPAAGPLSRTLPSADVIRRTFAASPITKQQYEQNILRSMRELTNKTAQVLHDHRYKYDIAFAHRRWPGLTTQAEDRIAKMFGKRGEISAWQARIADQVLGPIFGKNVADRAVMGINRLMMPLTLGFFDIGFPIMNALGTVQTMLPELAFIKAAGPKLARYYDWELVMKDGEALPFGRMSPVKMMKEGFKELFGSTDDGLRRSVQRAMQDGTVDPSFIEAFTGQEGAALLDIRKVLGGEASFGSWVESLLNFLPAKSEQFARLFAFTTGRRVGLLAGMSEEAAYQFATRFVHRTMYDYSTYARPQILTGPIGMFYGMFKTWPYNYLANLGTYTGEAMRGNFAPLLWAMGSTGAVAGATGMPFYFMVDRMAKLATNKSAMEWIYENSGYAHTPDDEFSARRTLVDMMAYGLPSIFGVTLASRAESPASNPARDLNMLISAASLDRFNYLGQAIGEGWRALHDTSTHPGNFRPAREKLIRAVSPRTIYRLYQSLANRGVRSLATGNEILPEMGFAKEVLYSLGLTPLDAQKHFDAMSILMEDRDKTQWLTAAYGEMAVDLVERQDYRGLAALTRRAFLDGVNPQSLVKSWQARYSKRNEELLDRSFDQYKALQVKRLLGVY